MMQEQQVPYLKKYGAAFKGKTLQSKSHECRWYEIRPSGNLRSKPLRG
jgi:hypothetical protein